MKKILLVFLVVFGCTFAKAATPTDSVKTNTISLLPTDVLKLLGHYNMKALASYTGNGEELYDGFIAEYQVINALDSVPTKLTCLFYGPKNTVSSIRFIVNDYKPIVEDFESQPGFPTNIDTSKYNHYKMVNYNKKGRFMDAILKFKGVACRIAPIMTSQYSVEYYTYTY